MSDIRLYVRPDCPFCWKVRIFEFEGELGTEEIFVDFGKKHPDVVSLNPNATVPVLVDGDLVIYDSALIIEYLGDKFPKTGLMVGSPQERAIIRQLHSYSDSKLGKVLFPYIKHVRENSGQCLNDELRQTTVGAWSNEQALLSNQLGDKDFLSKNFSVAECALIPRFSLALKYGLALDNQFENLNKWYERCINRSSYFKALPTSFPGLG
jgi:glutathione S-transferase